MPYFILSGGPDPFNGTFGNDTIEGRGGADTIHGADGNDSVNGGIGADQIWGDKGNDTLQGADGHDDLLGGFGNDVLRGEQGDDRLSGGAHDDILDGGDGWDRADYSPGAVSGVRVDLSIVGVAQNTGQGFDVLMGVEHLSGTGFGDTLTGDAGANWLWGNPEGTVPPGDDVIDGKGGDDLVQVGWGAHVLDGGPGVDTLSVFGAGYDVSGGGVTVSLALSVQATGMGTMDIAGFENLTGSLYADTLTGDAGDNLIAGHVGDDLLEGDDGDDVLLGDGAVTVDTHGVGTSGAFVTYGDVSLLGVYLAGDDTLRGGHGADTLQGGGRSDVLYGGTEPDVFVYRSVADSLPYLRDWIVDLERADTIDLSGIDADPLAPGDQPFTLVGGFSGAIGQAVLDYDAATDLTHLSLDVDGDAVADAVINILGKWTTDPFGLVL